MALKDGKDVRHFLWHEKEHMAIKEKTRMLNFQRRLYYNALERERKAYDKLVATQDKRKASYKPMFDTLAELDEEYGKGEMEDREYMSQRSRIWQVFSDRGHIANIEWLEFELARVDAKLNAIENVKKEFKNAEKKYRPSPKIARARKAAYERNRRRKIRRREREERWHRYGIG